ncbi:MAG: hypothetical protein ACTHJ4_06345 [Candidatus Nucleicultricaceae bacterium]
MVTRLFLILVVLLANEACCASSSKARGFFKNVVQKGVSRGASLYKSQGKISMPPSFSEKALFVKRKILPVLRDVQMSEESFIKNITQTLQIIFLSLEKKLTMASF